LRGQGSVSQTGSLLGRYASRLSLHYLQSTPVTFRLHNGEGTVVLLRCFVLTAN